MPSHSDAPPVPILAGKVAWVTGAGRGFGAGIAQGLALAGADVGICDVNAAELAVTADAIAAAGGEAWSQVVDVTDFGAMQAMADAPGGALGAARRRGQQRRRSCRSCPLREHTPDFWQKMIDVNLTGVYHGVWAAWPHLVRQGGGHCIAIASGASVRGFRDEVAYCAAKHAHRGLYQGAGHGGRAAQHRRQHDGTGQTDQADLDHPGRGGRRCPPRSAGSGSTRCSWRRPLSGWQPSRPPALPGCASTPARWPTPSPPKATTLPLPRKR